LPRRCAVLLVDDDPSLREALVAMLAAEDFDLVTAVSGEDALEKMRTMGTVDLLITDYEMPGMNGRELAESVRRQHPAVRVLYQTAYTDSLFGPRPLIEEGCAFLEKPFHARGLREAARLALFDALNPGPPVEPNADARHARPQTALSPKRG
jgi:DNA-binding NtrC family response regulator